MFYSNLDTKKTNNAQDGDQLPSGWHDAIFTVTQAPMFAFFELASGKHTKNYGKAPFLMGKSTINGRHVK